ncbi:MAG: ABC transporter permease [Gemmataceae bacterium]
MGWKPDWQVAFLVMRRELLDQLRDRRTMFMVLALPILLYPLLGFAVMQLALSLEEQASMIGVVGIECFPQAGPLSAGQTPLPAVSCLSVVTPVPGSNGLAALVSVPAQWRALQQVVDEPPLFVRQGANWAVPLAYFERDRQARLLSIRALDEAEADPLLAARELDLVVRVPADLQERLRKGQAVAIEEASRNDERAQRAQRRFHDVLEHWESVVKTVRLRRQGLPDDFDDPVYITQRGRPDGLDQTSQTLEDTLIRMFPFMIVMWAMAGAMYPAVDVCAGEKERGTMETLLISPAGRLDIACGKFLTIWVISIATSVWNLLGMSITLWMITRPLPQPVPSIGSFTWSVLAVVPLAAFFSAVCLAIGVYARSTKEGQYYLMPLFLITLPLVFLSAIPDVTLNALTALVPVTGVTLLMQQVMTASPGNYPWLYFGPVLLSVAFYSWIALYWAGRQFQREEVLFRVK